MNWMNILVTLTFYFFVDFVWNSQWYIQWSIWFQSEFWRKNKTSFKTERRVVRVFKIISTNILRVHPPLFVDAGLAGHIIFILYTPYVYDGAGLVGLADISICIIIYLIWISFDSMSLNNDTTRVTRLSIILLIFLKPRWRFVLILRTSSDTIEWK